MVFTTTRMDFAPEHNGYTEDLKLTLVGEVPALIRKGAME